MPINSDHLNQLVEHWSEHLLEAIPKGLFKEAVKNLIVSVHHNSAQHVLSPRAIRRLKQQATEGKDTKINKAFNKSFKALARVAERK